MGAPGLAFETWDPGNEFILGKPSDPQCTWAFRGNVLLTEVKDLRFLSSPLQPN
jgi:hypothetical protein